MPTALTRGYEPSPGWKLVRKLGNKESGFGEVWLAYNKDMRKYAAFKFIKSSTPPALASLRNEVAKLRSLTLPGIVPLQDAGLTHAIPWLRYEYIDGSVDLATATTYFQDDYGRLAPSDVHHLILNITRIVAECHSLNPPLVHRDLNPRNILLSDYGLLSLISTYEDADIGRPGLGLLPCFLIDFGISTHVREDRGTTHFVSEGRAFDGCGTWVWSSPQQSGGKESHPSDDVYSLGCLWWSLLTARAPEFPHVFEDFEAGLGGTELDAPLRSLLLRCLSPTRAKRPTNAGLVLKELESALPVAISARQLLDRVTKRRQLVCDGDLTFTKIRHLSGEWVRYLLAGLQESDSRQYFATLLLGDSEDYGPFDRTLCINLQDVETVGPGAGLALTNERIPALSIAGQSDKQFARTLRAMAGRKAPLWIKWRDANSPHTSQALASFDGNAEIIIHIDWISDAQNLRCLSKFRGTLTFCEEQIPHLNWDCLTARRLRMYCEDFAGPDLRSLGQFPGDLQVFLSPGGNQREPTCESLAQIVGCRASAVTINRRSDLSPLEQTILPGSFVKILQDLWRAETTHGSTYLRMQLVPQSTFWQRHRDGLLRAHSKSFLVYLYENRDDPDVAFGLRLPLHSLPLGTIRKMVEEGMIHKKELCGLMDVIRPVAEGPPDVLWHQRVRAGASGTSHEVLQCNEWPVLDEYGSSWISQRCDEEDGRVVSLEAVKHITLGGAKAIEQFEKLTLVMPAIDINRLSAETVAALCRADRIINGEAAVTFASEWLGECVKLAAAAEDRERREEKARKVVAFCEDGFSELSVRVRVGLAKLGVRTLGELVDKTEEWISEVGHFGETSLQTIKDALGERGLRLRTSRLARLKKLEKQRQEQQAQPTQEQGQEPPINYAALFRQRQEKKTDNR